VSSNEQKTPLAQSLNKFGAAKARDATQMLGKGLPCTVAQVISPGIVLVNFEVATTPFTLPQIKMPVSKDPYVQLPIQVGDKGVALSAGLRTGALTGLGGGTPNLQDTVGNLSAMTFFWLGHADEEFLDPEAYTIYRNITATPDKLGFFGAPKVSKATLPPAATDLPTVITLANAMRSYIILLGLAD